MFIGVEAVCKAQVSVATPSAGSVPHLRNANGIARLPRQLAMVFGEHPPRTTSYGSTMSGQSIAIGIRAASSVAS